MNQSDLTTGFCDNMHDMPRDELMRSIGSAYLWLIHPDVDDPECRQNLDIIDCAESRANSMTVQKLLTGESCAKEWLAMCLPQEKGRALSRLLCLNR